MSFSVTMANTQLQVQEEAIQGDNDNISQYSSQEGEPEGANRIPKVLPRTLTLTIAPIKSDESEVIPALDITTTSDLLTFFQTKIDIAEFVTCFQRVTKENFLVTCKDTDCVEVMLNDFSKFTFNDIDFEMKRAGPLVWEAMSDSIDITIYGLPFEIGPRAVYRKLMQFCQIIDIRSPGFKDFPNIMSGVRIVKAKVINKPIPRKIYISGQLVTIRYEGQPISEKQCYNCKEYGHISKECTKEKRVWGKTTNTGYNNEIGQGARRKTGLSNLFSARWGQGFEKRQSQPYNPNARDWGDEPSEETLRQPPEYEVNFPPMRNRFENLSENDDETRSQSEESETSQESAESQGTVDSQESTSTQESAGTQDSQSSQESVVSQEKTLVEDELEIAETVEISMETTATSESDKGEKLLDNIIRQNKKKIAEMTENWEDEITPVINAKQNETKNENGKNVTNQVTVEKIEINTEVKEIEKDTQNTDILKPDENDEEKENGKHEQEVSDNNIKGKENTTVNEKEKKKVEGVTKKHKHHSAKSVHHKHKGDDKKNSDNSEKRNEKRKDRYSTGEGKKQVEKRPKV